MRTERKQQSGSPKKRAAGPKPAARKAVGKRSAPQESAGKGSAASAARQAAKPKAPAAVSLPEVLARLERASTARDRDNLARFGIVAAKHYGVSMANVQKLGRSLGRDHALALSLWKSGWYEARLLASFVADPTQISAALMDAWCRDFDNWAVCDTLCFYLFDRTPHAWAKVAAWHDRSKEFEKRAAFALLASLAGHDKAASDQRFLDSLRFIEKAAADERNFVKKGVNWALRRIGWRNAALNAAAVKLSRRLADSAEAAPRWIGKDALRELTSAKVQKRLKA